MLPIQQREWKIDARSSCSGTPHAIELNSANADADWFLKSGSISKTYQLALNASLKELIPPNIPIDKVMIIHSSTFIKPIGDRANFIDQINLIQNLVEIDYR